MLTKLYNNNQLNSSKAEIELKLNETISCLFLFVEYKNKIVVIIDIVVI